VASFPPAADPRHGVVPNGVRLPEQCLYVASTTGPDPHSNPPRYYLLPRSADLADLEARITAAMSGETILTVDFTGPADPGVVVLNGGAFRSWRSAQPLPVAEHPGRAGGNPACMPRMRSSATGDSRRPCGVKDCGSSHALDSTEIPVTGSPNLRR
jgi:hypothetical protein